MSDATQSPAVRRFGAFEINLQSGELRKNGMRLRLSGQPFQVLAVLVERAGQVVTREELRSKLWPADTFVDFDHGLNNAVARIRETLDDSSDAPRYVETVPRRGYRFIALVTDLAPPIGSSASGSTPGPDENVAAAQAVNPEVSLTSRAPSSHRWRIGAVAVLAVLAAGLAAYLARHAAGARTQAISSLAVLPLKNLSGDPSQEYLSDGMTEELIGRLSMISGLRVISRTSTMHFKDTQLSAPEIAKALNVDTLVEGSVIREGGRVRVHAQLIRAATDEHFWSETYDRDLKDALALESEVAQSIARKVEVTVTGAERARLVAARPVAPDVYESYLRGRFTPGSRKADLEKAIAYFQEAIEKDPNFAPAWVGLAEAHSALDTIVVGGSPDVERPKEMEAARKALELDPTLSEPHVLLGELEQVQWHWADAEAEFKRALELDPNSADAHLVLANWLLCQGRLDEALLWSRRARALDPIGISGHHTGWILFHARRYEEAIRELRSDAAVRPDNPFTLNTLGFALIGAGRSIEAIPVLEKSASLMNRSPGTIELLATANARAGRRKEALQLIDELKGLRRTGYMPPGALINPYLALGDYDEAFVWFDRAYKEHSNIMQFLKVHPFFDPIRADPRFKDLLHRVDLDH